MENSLPPALDGFPLAKEYKPEARSITATRERSMLSQCPKDLPTDLHGHLVAFAEGWARHGCWPIPGAEVLRAWDKLIDSWSQQDKLPLFIRKAGENRGQELRHVSGRILIPVDNSPAQWAYALACDGKIHDVTELPGMLERDDIPVAMVLKKAERAKARYRQCLGKFGTATAGWKLGHLKPVGLGHAKGLEIRSIMDLQQHFQDLMKPSNMFLVPLAWAGLAEIPEVHSAIRNILRMRG